MKSFINAIKDKESLSLKIPFDEKFIKKAMDEVFDESEGKLLPITVDIEPVNQSTKLCKECQFEERNGHNPSVPRNEVSNPLKKIAGGIKQGFSKAMSPFK